MRSLVTLLLLVPLTGCAAFLIQPEDSTATKAAKITARVPLALVSVGNSEIIYYCARGLDAGPPSFAVDEEDAVPGQPEERLALTPDERLDRCWEQVQADWEASNSAFSNSGWMNQQPPLWDQSKDARHHRKGHRHHHGHGC